MKNISNGDSFFDYRNVLKTKTRELLDVGRVEQSKQLKLLARSIDAALDLSKDDFEPPWDGAAAFRTMVSEVINAVPSSGPGKAFVIIESLVAIQNTYDEKVRTVWEPKQVCAHRLVSSLIGAYLNSELVRKMPSLFFKANKDLERASSFVEDDGN
ncbi:MAG: hypothetical protein KBC98_00145 [Candidatus Pacebacteria bacterium]|nr:hypothetical protein [Candidatus Paceibacterota bacterium]